MYMKVTTTRSKSSETFYICHSFVDKNGVLIAIADGALIGNSAAIIQNGHLTIMIIHILHIRTDNIIIHPSYVFFNAHFL